jgi:monofunctional glycosyltransferase
MPSKFKTILLGSLVTLILLGGAVFYDLALRVPDFSRLKESVEVSIRLANGDKAVRLMGPKTAGWTPLSAISEWLPRAVVSSEDGSFYSHKGIDVFEMQEALKKDLKEGRFARGASTLTQQVLKNVYLLNHPKVWRKVKEIAWAGKLEVALTKPQILAFYLNMAEWGPGIYGIGEASRHYFSCSPASLTPKQSAFLAMLLPSPRRYHAYFRQKRLTEWAEKRVNRILQVLLKMGQLSDEQFALATSEKLWGNPVLEDSAPGVPSDPGWAASESPEERFEAPEVAHLKSPKVVDEAEAPAAEEVAPLEPEPVYND